MDVKMHRNRSGVWELRWTERRADGTFRSRTLSTRTSDRKDAEAFRVNWLAAVEEQAKPDPTLAELIDAYLRFHVEAKKKTPAQAWSLRPVRAALGPLTVSQLTHKVQDQYRRDRLGAGRQSGTVRRELGALVAVLNWAGRNRQVDREAIPAVDLPPEGSAREEFLDETQEREFWDLAMLDSLNKPRLSRVTRFVALALDTAARKEAIEELTWDRVDFASGLIDFRVPGRSANNKRRAVVPMSKRLRPVLERARRDAVDEYVIDRGAIRKAYEKWVRKTPYPTIGPHDLRRTWATLAARAGVPLWDIAGVLADSIETVTKHYARHQPDHLRRAIDARHK